LGAREEFRPPGLAAPGVADDADELAARHRQPQLLEHGGAAAARRRKALADAFDGDEFIGHALCDLSCPGRGAARNVVERCTADPGPPRTGTVPGLQRIT